MSKRLLFFLPLLILFVFLVWNPLQAADDNRIRIFVSILPQKNFVEQIGEKKVEVSVMVGPGQSPANYEPLPRQMSMLSRADLYFSIGVPFEVAWMDKIQAANTKMKTVDTREGISLRKIEDHHHGESHEGEHHEHEAHVHETLDPHIWLNPLLVKVQAETIFNHLITLDPENKGFYEKNLYRFMAELDALDREIEEAFAEMSTEKIMVFHPAWGYFCDRYGLTQVPIEIEGKEPGPRELAKIIEFAKAEKIRVVFVQAQFSSKQAETVAKAIQGKVVSMDPLAENYIENMRKIAQVIKEELK